MKQTINCGQESIRRTVNLLAEHESHMGMCSAEAIVHESYDYEAR